MRWNILLLGLLAATAGAAEVPLEDLVERYRIDREELESFYSPNSSPARLERLDSFATDWQAKLAAIDFDGLPQDGKVDYLLMADHLRHDLAQRAATRARWAEAEPVVAFARVIVDLEEARRRLEPLDPQVAANTLEKATTELDAVKKRLERGKAGTETPEDAAKSDDPPIVVTPVVAMRASSLLGQSRRTLEEWFRFYDGYVPEFGWWVRKPYERLQKALEDLDGYLKRELAGVKGEPEDPLIGDPIGREALLAELTVERIPYSPEELLAIGEREMAWCEVEMAKVAAELGFDTWREALGHVKTLHAPPGGQADIVAAQAREAIAFVETRDLVTVPPLCEETWRLEMITADGQRTMPFAAYSGQRMLVAYPTEGMAHESKLMSMRGNNMHFTRIVTPHELIPGHHLQGFMAARHRPYRELFRTPFLVEGWSLYWERRLWNLGWGHGPEDRAGMLFWRAHRCARILVSLKFHLGEMTPQQMIDTLVDRVGHERDGATSEVRRYVSGGYGPLYQCAYMIGGIQLEALHDELVGVAGWPERKFHDAVLEQGSVPIEMIRAALTGQSLKRDQPPAWHFDGE